MVGVLVRGEAHGGHAAADDGALLPPAPGCLPAAVTRWAAVCRLRGWDVTRMYAQIRSEWDVAIARFEQQMPAAAEQSTKAANSTTPSRRPRDLGPSSLIRLHATLHAALNAAVWAGEIPSNPAKQAEVSRSRQAKSDRGRRRSTARSSTTFQTQDRMAALFHLADHRRYLLPPATHRRCTRCRSRRSTGNPSRSQPTA